MFQEHLQPYFLPLLLLVYVVGFVGYLLRYLEELKREIEGLIVYAESLKNINPKIVPFVCFGIAVYCAMLWPYTVIASTIRNVSFWLWWQWKKRGATKPPGIYYAPGITPPPEDRDKEQ